MIERYRKEQEHLIDMYKEDTEHLLKALCLSQKVNYIIQSL